MTDDEKFFAWLDGELGPAEAAEVEATVAGNSELARLADRHRALKAQLRGAFDPIAATPAPAQLQAAIRPAADVIDFGAAMRARRMPPLPQWTALAATLAVGIFVGTMVPQRGSGPVEVRGGRIYAAASLNQALETQLASAPTGEVRIGLTFRDHAGEICRSFMAQASSGLACRSGGRWQLKGMFAAPESEAGDYRMAGMDPNLAALTEATMAGEPLDATAEKAARDRGWR
jgi:hypothetical protein